MTDAARRERADELRTRAMDWLEARVKNGPPGCEVYDFETFAIGYSDHRDLARLVGFCAGAREEAAEKDKEIIELRDQQDALILTIDDAHRIMDERHAEIAALNGKIIMLDLNCAERLLDLDAARAEIAALREAVSLQGSALREIRIRLHAAGRRPEECYEMSILDDTIAAVRRALEEASIGRRSDGRERLPLR